MNDGVKRDQADVAPVVIRNLAAHCEIGVAVHPKGLVGVVLQLERLGYQVFGEAGRGVDGVRPVCQNVVAGIEGLEGTVDRIDQPVGIHVDQQPSDGGEIQRLDFPDISSEKEAGSTAASGGPADRAVAGRRILQGIMDKSRIGPFVGGPVCRIGKCIVIQDDVGDAVLPECLIIG